MSSLVGRRPMPTVAAIILTIAAACQEVVAAAEDTAQIGAEEMLLV
jgi:hypothetical protein